jgi:hypothetical protein
MTLCDWWAWTILDVIRSPGRCRDLSRRMRTHSGKPNGPPGGCLGSGARLLSSPWSTRAQPMVWHQLCHPDRVGGQWSLRHRWTTAECPVCGKRLSRRAISPSGNAQFRPDNPIPVRPPCPESASFLGWPGQPASHPAGSAALSTRPAFGMQHAFLNLCIGPEPLARPIVILVPGISQRAQGHNPRVTFGRRVEGPAIEGLVR